MHFFRKRFAFLFNYKLKKKTFMRPLKTFYEFICKTSKKIIFGRVSKSLKETERKENNYFFILYR